MTDGDDEKSTSGRMRFQDETTTAREPTLAEKRARQQAAKRAEEQRQAAEQERADSEVKSARRRKRVLIGAGVTVGVVAVIAVGYAMAQPDEEVQAQCVDEETGIVVEDDNCVTPVASGTHYGGGGYPIFIGGNGRQYRYNYGSTGGFGQPAVGGTSTPPKDGTVVRTPGGRVLSSPSISGTSGGGSTAGSPSSGGSGTSGGDVTRGGFGTSGDSSSSGS